MFLKKINENLEKAIIELGFEQPNEIEKACFPIIKSGKDVIGIGAEGTGKTSVIVMGVIQKLKAAINDVPRALIIVPDKESALSMKEMFDAYGKYTNLRVHCAYDKGKIQDQKDAIYFGADVVIGTAKRLNELYSNYGLNLGDLKMFIIDDADLVIRNMYHIHTNRFAATIKRCQQLVFSSKMTEKIADLEYEFMNFPQTINIE
jgi:superfamily II DNA/RNA helicase